MDCSPPLCLRMRKKKRGKQARNTQGWGVSQVFRFALSSSSLAIPSTRSTIEGRMEGNVSIVLPSCSPVPPSHRRSNKMPCNSIEKYIFWAIIRDRIFVVVSRSICSWEKKNKKTTTTIGYFLGSHLYYHQDCQQSSHPQHETTNTRSLDERPARSYG